MQRFLFNLFVLFLLMGVPKVAFATYTGDHSPPPRPDCSDSRFEFVMDREFPTLDPTLASTIRVPFAHLTMPSGCGRHVRGFTFLLNEPYGDAGRHLLAVELIDDESDTTLMSSMPLRWTRNSGSHIGEVRMNPVRDTLVTGEHTFSLCFIFGPDVDDSEGSLEILLPYWESIRGTQVEVDGAWYVHTADLFVEHLVPEASASNETDSSDELHLDMPRDWYR